MPQAAAAARNVVLVAVIADVARAYVDLRGLQMRSAVLHSALDLLQRSLEIENERYQRGITNELDVTLATREYDSLRAQVARLDAQVSAAQYAIATLLGRYPQELVQELAPQQVLPLVPPAVAAGMPVDLLRRRPDVQVAERELAAATARIGVATGNLFPSGGTHRARSACSTRAGAAPRPVSRQHIWSAGPAAAWPLLDFGALDAQLQVANLETRALLVNYRKVIQTAVQQVDTVLSAYAAEQQSLASLGDALVASRRAVTLANERYNRGLTDFLNVVDAERQAYTIEDQYAQAQATACEEFVALYQSLGGGWQNYQDLPPITTPLPAVAAAFRELFTRNTALQAPASAPRALSASRAPASDASRTARSRPARVPW